MTPPPLGDSAERPRFIETLPRRGYRFLAPVSSGDRKVAGRTRAWKIVVAVVAVAALVAGGLFWRSRRAQRLTEKDTIVLADFANTTGESVFDDALKEGLQMQLEQSPFLSILSDDKVSEQLSLMGRSKDERLTKELARDLCQRVGSKAVLAGSISSIGTHYVIGLNAFNCRSGDALAREQVEADNRERVLKALGESAAKMREKLGESLVTIQKYDVPLEQATTPSLEALKAHSLGLRTWYTKGASAAIPFFRRAVELDPNFALAYARMGARYDELGKSTLAAENIRKAYELRNKVSERERLYIETHYYESVTGDLERAVPVFEVWQQTYPRDETPFNNLAYLYANVFGNYERALQEAREAVRLGPDQDNYGVLCALYLRLNRLNEAAVVLKQAEELKLQSELLLWDRHTLASLRGNSLEKEPMMATSAGNRDAEDILHREEAWSEAYHGRLKKARALFRQLRESAQHDGNIDGMNGSQVAAACVEAYLGAGQQARADAAAALRLDPDRYVQAEAALALALAGDAKRAEELAGGLEKSWAFDTGLRLYWLPTIRASVALERQSADQALAVLKAMSSYDMVAIGNMEPVYLRGLAYLMQREGSAAATEFQKMIDHPGIVLHNPVGALARLGLARAYALQGDTAKARTSYQDFLTLWKDADPDIPILKKAKEEYARLR